MTTTLNTSIRDWYKNTYPECEYGEDLHDVSFNEVDEALGYGFQIYDYIFITGGDSIVRETIFAKLAELQNVEYDVIYRKWLDNSNLD